MKKTKLPLLLLFCLAAIFSLLPVHAEPTNSVASVQASAAAVASIENLGLLKFLPANWQIFALAFFSLLGQGRLAGKILCSSAHKFFKALGWQQDDEFLTRVENSQALRTLLFWIDLLVSWKPYRGPSEPIAAQPSAASNLTTPAAPNPPRPPAPTFPSSAAVIFLIGLTSFFAVGCAPLQPGADPLLVRTEQIEKAAASTFDFLLNIDDANRDFYRTNAPQFHAAMEKLREKEDFHGTNYPRSIAVVLRLNEVKTAYRTDRSNSNFLATAVTGLEATVAEVQNLKPK